MSTQKGRPGNGFAVFENLSAEHVEAIEALGQVLTLPEATEFITLGAPAERLFLIRRGRVALYMPLALRGEQQNILLEEKDPGSVVGWSAFVPPHRSTLTGRTVVQTELLAIHGASLHQLFVRRPDAGLIFTSNVAEMIGRRLHTVQAMWVRAMQRVAADLDRAP